MCECVFVNVCVGKLRGGQGRITLVVIWLVRLFETVFQSISNCLQKEDGELKGTDSTDET